MHIYLKNDHPNPMRNDEEAWAFLKRSPQQEQEEQDE